MSIHALAALITRSRADGACLVRETWSTVLLSKVPAELTRTLVPLAEEAALAVAIEDEGNHDVALTEVDDIQAPYRVVLSKPSGGDPTEGYLLTVENLDDLLLAIDGRKVIQVAGLTQRIEAVDALLLPWGNPSVRVTAVAPTKSPRSVVAEVGNSRVVPTSLACWLMVDPEWHDGDPAFRRWAELATVHCLLALPHEVSGEPTSLVLKGPPKGTLAIPDADDVDEDLFLAAQACARWVYESPAETEMRHALIVAELARYTSPGIMARVAAGILTDALSGARLAYQLGMSKLSSDTLKMLTDLRKSVLDEATKVADGTRSLVAAVATTLSLGVGMVAAKVGTHADGRIIGAIAVIAVAYVLAIVWSGYRAIALQDRIRDQWKSRTYGFIASDNYEELVSQPATLAAEAYRSIARIGIVLTLVMFVVVLWSVIQFS